MSGCGCGGHSAVAVGGAAVAHDGCGCGGGCGSCGCDGVMAGEGFVRPRFFDGMLLTEDDLQAAVDYTVAKRKLTNRQVLGDGVVSGLDVTCHPCDAGKVNVSPGYAIECCGNDILVSCAEEVDVVALVRELRLRKGVDCGEPCGEQPHANYHLVIRYVESPTAPVAPYASDDCATGECEFSRMTEGYRFELRCDVPARAGTVLDALRACRSDDKVLDADTRRMTQVLRVATVWTDAVNAPADAVEPTPEPPSKSDFDALAGEQVTLAAGVELLTRAVRTLAFEATAAKSTLKAKGRAVVADGGKALATRLRALPELAAAPPDERARIERLLTIAETQPDLSTLGRVDRALLREGLTAAEADTVFATGAEDMRDSILHNLSASGQTSCSDYRRLVRMRFDGLGATSQADALALAHAYMRSVSACTCSAFSLPCPTCTDDAVLLARVRVEGCEVTEVCTLERHWVLSPRALGYWIPVVDMFRACLERACCGPYDPAAERMTPLQCMDRSLEAAMATVRNAFSAMGGGVGAMADLEAAMGSAGVKSLATDAAPAYASPPAGATAPPAVTAEAAATIGALEAQVAALAKRLDELAPGPAPVEAPAAKDAKP